MSIWSDRIKALEGRGFKLAAIAVETGIPVTTLSDLKQKRSKSPRYENAMKIEKFHARVVGRAA
jgi:hypothetical protein